jgi:hypothetical protein
VGLGAINMHNETHSTSISVGTKTNNLTFEKFIFQTKIANIQNYRSQIPVPNQERIGVVPVLREKI